VHAPDHLAGGLKVARKLRRMFLISLTDECTESDRARYQRFLRVLFWIEHNTKDLSTQIFSDETYRELFQKSTGRNPMINQGAENHGLWTLLWEHCPDRDRQPAFRSLQHHATVSHMAVMQYWKARPEWQPGSRPATTLLNALYHETRCIRHFVMPAYTGNADYIKVLIQVGVEISKSAKPISKLDLTTALQNMRAPHTPTEPDAKPKSIYSDLGAIVWLLKRASEPKKLRQPKRTIVSPPPDPGGNVIHPIPPKPPPSLEPPINFELDYSPVDDLDEEDAEDDSGGGNENDDSDGKDNGEDEPSDAHSVSRAYNRRHWSPNEIDNCLSSGTHPTDELPSSSIYLSHRKSGPRRGGGWEAMKNQLFCWSPEEIPPELLAEGMQILQMAASRGGLAELELYARAAIILRIGATGPAMRDMVVRTDHPSEIKSLTLVLTEVETFNQSEWIIPALPLRLETKLELSPGYRICEDHFVLPDYTAVGTIIRRLLFLQTGCVWNDDQIEMASAGVGEQPVEGRPLGFRAGGFFNELCNDLIAALCSHLA
jgi:hypothetical protein